MVYEVIIGVTIIITLITVIVTGLDHIDDIRLMLLVIITIIKQRLNILVTRKEIRQCTRSNKVWVQEL